MSRILPLLLAAAVLAPPSSAATATPARSPLGAWNAAVVSPGGDIPFGLVVEAKGVPTLGAYVINGDEKAPFTSVKLTGSTVTLRFDHYDSQIGAGIPAAGPAMKGRGAKQARRDRPGRPFTASQGP